MGSQMAYMRVRIQRDFYVLLYLCVYWGVTSVLLLFSNTHIDTAAESSWNVMAHGEAREGKWRGNWRTEWVESTLHTTSEQGVSSIRGQLKCDDTRAETRFRLSAKRTSSFKSAGGVSSVDYWQLRSADEGCKTTGYPLHSHLSPSLPLPCVTVCRLIPIQLLLLYLCVYWGVTSVLLLFSWSWSVVVFRLQSSELAWQT
jgi:hypothetical protein